MKLRKLHIEDYKMFKDFDISFVDENDEALPIVILAGVNGSGKTTLLECLAIGRDRYTLKVDDNGNANFDFEMDFSWFKNYDDIIYFPVKQKTSVKTNICEEETILNNLDKYFYKEYLKIAKKKDSFSHALKVLQEYIEEIFKGFNLNFKLKDIDTTTEVAIFENDNNEDLKIDDLSSGEKTLLSKILFLYLDDIRDKVILIDEPELSLHPSWQNKVLKIYENFAKQNNCQIIIATHSPHIIGSAKNEYLRLLVKEENKVVVKELNGSPLDRDTNTILKTVMGANYLPKELETLRHEYRELFNQELEDTLEAKELEKKILEWESPNSSFWQGLAFDKELRSI